MTLQDLRDEISNRADDDIISSTLDRWINMAIKQWATRADWPSLYETDSSDVTVAGTQEYTLPTDFKKMIGMRLGTASTTTEEDATELTYIQYESKNVSSDIQAYYLNPADGTYGIVPEPTTSGLPVYQKYIKIPADLTLVTEEPPFDENFHELCIFFGLKKYWEVNDDFQKSVFYDTEFENMIERMKVDVLNRSRGDLKRMRDIRELHGLEHPQGTNTISLGK